MTTPRANNSPESASRSFDPGPLAQDITDCIQVDGALRASSDRLQKASDFNQVVMANMGEGLYALNAQGFVSYVNPAAEKMLGWTSAELLGRRMHDVAHYKYPDGRPFPAEECPGFQVLRKGAVLTEQADTFIRRDGSFFVSSTAPHQSSPAVRSMVWWSCFVMSRNTNEPTRNGSSW